MFSSREELEKKTSAQLRGLCKNARRSTSGRKATLVKRLLNIEEEARTTMEGVKFTFNDVNEALPIFTGTAEHGIEQWISEIEEAANDPEAQRFIYGRRLVKGSARKVIESETGITDWRKLKAILVEEFRESWTAADVHSMLRQRKQQIEEPLRDYVCAMKTIAKRTNVDEASLCQYIVEGIAEKPRNKTMLYGISNMTTLKQRIREYERMMKQLKDEEQDQKQNSKKIQQKERRVAKGEMIENNEKCHNCGGFGHYAKQCEHREKGPKCYKCLQFGHRARECKTENTNMCVSCPMVPTVSVTINGIKCHTLVDTGSKYNLMSENIYKKMGKPILTKTEMTFTGFGAKITTPRGKMVLNVTIHDQEIQGMNFYVVPEWSMNFDAVLGMEALLSMEVKFVEGEILVSKRKPECEEKEEIDLEKEQFMSMMMVSDDVELDIPPRYTTIVREMVEQYTPKTDVVSRVTTKINMRDETPVHTTPRRMAPKEKSILEKTINEWLTAGVIKESRSEYASPVALAPKKDGTMRVCIDYRELNKRIIRDCFPMRNMEDQVDQLRRAKVFTTLDLKNSFFHVPVEEESRKYTGFVTHIGQYEFLRTPFGLANSPASFSRFISDVFRELIAKGCLMIYVDDVIIPSEDYEENIEKIREVLKRAAEYGIQFNWKKSQFLRNEVEYLGYVIKDGSYRISPTKTRAVQHYREPRNVKEVQRFLGLASYFRKFVLGFADIAKPLTKLLRKNAEFEFGEPQRRSFETIKQRLTSDPVLMIYDPEAETEVHTDASKEGYGAVLLQKNDDNRFHPVYFMSQSTNDAEKNYSAYHLEVLAVVKALQKFRVYLLGIPFKIVTDCSAFKHTLKGKELNARIARWALQLEKFTYEVEHRAGDRMRHVDALSRTPIMIINSPAVDIMKSGQSRDERIRAIMELLKTKPFDDYIVSDGLLKKVIDGRELVVVPRELQDDVIRRVHENGHFGVRKLTDVISREYYIPNVAEKIRKHIDCCVKCILAERKRGKIDGLLIPIPKGDVPFNTYHVDHIGPMDTTEKLYKYLFVVVDAFTKYTWIYSTKTTNAQEVIQRLTRQNAMFGNPRRIISDKGAAFTSNEFKTYCEEQSIERTEITTGVPRGNGQLERVNQVIIAMLTKLSVNDRSKWYKHVERIQLWINGNLHQSTSVSPFEALFGVKMRHEDDICMAEMLEEIRICQFDKQRNGVRSRAKEAIEKAQKEQRATYNLRARPIIG